MDFKKIFFFYLITINVIAFFLCFIDKRKAIKNKSRIPEKTLILVCSLGGCYLFLLAMYLFRHKTKKLKFYLGIPLIIIVFSIFIYLINSIL